MDLILEMGTSVSVSQSFRSSTLLSSDLTSLQQQARQIQSESASLRQNQGNSDTRAASNTNAEEAEISALGQTIRPYTDRILEQVDRLQERQQNALRSQSTGTASGTNAATPGGSQFTMSVEMRSYLQLIRQLSNDKEAFDKFLDQMDSFLNGEVDQSKSIDEFMASMNQEFGISTIDLQQSFAVKFQVQINSRTASETRNSESAQVSEQTQAQAILEAEPLVFDLDGNGLDLTTVEEGVQFDINGTGKKVQTAFVTGNDAFLALDRNGNGTIDSGKELFGDQHGAKDGIEELRKFDDNQDGVIDQNDAVYDQLRLWVDRNRDGISQKNELFSLHKENIVSISLDAQEENQRIAGNRLAASTYFQRSDGSRNQVGEMYLNYFA